jgi:hypothetical protein
VLGSFSSWKRGVSIKRNWKWLALGVMGLAAGIWLVRLFLNSRGFDWRAFRATLLSLRWWWLAAASGSVIAGYYGRALRWRVLMRPVKPEPSLWNLFSATVIGFSAITVLGRPGEFVRPYLIAAKEKVSASSQMAAFGAGTHLRCVDRAGHLRFRVGPRAPLGCGAGAGAFLGVCYGRMVGGGLVDRRLGAADGLSVIFPLRACGGGCWIFGSAWRRPTSF